MGDQIDTPFPRENYPQKPSLIRVNERAIVDSAAVSSGSCVPSNPNQRDIAEDENEDEFIPEIDINDTDESLDDGLSDKVFDDMFQEALFSYDEGTVHKRVNEKLHCSNPYRPIERCCLLEHH